ncbi:large ribosomal subunit protein mL42 isoform 1-T1 [Synchiropus picturatus]
MSAQLYRLLFSRGSTSSLHRCLAPQRFKSDVTSHHDPHSQVEVAVTSDMKTVVCYHPTVDVPYDLTQAIEHPDPVSSPPESHDQVLKAHLDHRQPAGPSIEQLSRMFFTTKHRWYPVGQYHSRRRKKSPPQDR